jgi:hypothetical protein
MYIAHTLIYNEILRVHCRISACFCYHSCSLVNDACVAQAAPSRFCAGQSFHNSWCLAHHIHTPLAEIDAHLCILCFLSPQVGHKWINGSQTLVAAAAVQGAAPRSNSSICSSTSYSFTASFGPFKACNTMQVGAPYFPIACTLHAVLLVAAHLHPDIYTYVL